MPVGAVCIIAHVSIRFLTYDLTGAELAAEPAATGIPRKQSKINGG